MHPDIVAYNQQHSDENRAICDTLAAALDANLPKALSKIWHRTAVWFIDENPVAGYAVRKKHVQLLFWSGQSFDVEGLEPEGSFKAAQKFYTAASQIKSADLKKWCAAAKRVQWDYKNIVKRKGRLEKIGDW
jgi:hypothetical protein